MNLDERIRAFSELGETIRNGLSEKNNEISDRLDNLISQQYINNAWFTPENVRLSLESIAGQLTIFNLTKWVSAYPEINRSRNPATIGIIMAGNIPLVGFHDFISVLITGHNILAKTSSKDTELITFLSDALCIINPEFRKMITFTEGFMKGFDGIIATGSDNTSRYFKYYFGRYPNIIRKNRNSIAVIEGNETDEELQGLGRDIFSYFGLGCRNVSKLFVPAGYDFKNLIINLDSHSQIVNHSKYANNYDFNKAVYLINKEKFLDTGYLLLKEESRLSSPVAVVHYEYYDSAERVAEFISNSRESIQCITGENYITPGTAQMPYLWDYADGIDTVDFLLKKFSNRNIVK